MIKVSYNAFKEAGNEKMQFEVLKAVTSYLADEKFNLNKNSEVYKNGVFYLKSDDGKVLIKFNLKNKDNFNDLMNYLRAFGRSLATKRKELIEKKEVKEKKLKHLKRKVAGLNKELAEIKEITNYIYKCEKKLAKFYLKEDKQEIPSDKEVIENLIALYLNGELNEIEFVKDVFEFFAEVKDKDELLKILEEVLNDLVS